MKVREGDFIEDTNGLIFDVKGLIHPPNKVIAFVRYIPAPQGDRERGGVKYTKIYELSRRYDFLMRNHPQYIVHDDVFDEYLPEVPLGNLVNHFKPRQKTNQLLHKSNLDPIEHQTLNFIKILHQASNISQGHIGVSGSLLVGLHTQKSDIDLLVYGQKNSLILRDSLKQLLYKEGIRPYRLNELKDRYQVRQKYTPVSFQDYVYHESRKSFQGLFQKRDFFFRYVKDWGDIREKYGNVVYKNLGSATIKAKIVDDSESIFTPCTYSITNVEVLEGMTRSPITEISSFRGRFCEQALIDEVVLARGKLEMVAQGSRIHYRLLLGNRVTDYMVSLYKT